MLKDKTIWDVFKEYFLIALGLTIYVIGWSIFLLPNNLVGGGVSGLSAIIYYATGFKMGYSYFIINAILLVIGIKILGSGFGKKTIFAVLYTSSLFTFLPNLIPTELTDLLAVSNGKLLCTIMGGAMAGFGIGMSVDQGGSSGGTDIIALIIAKYTNITIGRLILWMDFVIIALSMFFPSYTASGELMPTSEKMATAIYGFILITVCGFGVDMYLSGAKQSVQAFIFSKKHEKIADMVVYDLRRGVSLVPAKGWYSKEDGFVVMVITRKSDLNRLLRNVKQIDPDAFLSVGSVMGVYGFGFDTIKVKNKAHDQIK